LPSRAEGSARLRVGGLTRWTSIDFPGRLAAVVFCQGCPWRCSYCHNPALLEATAPPALAWDGVLAFLRGRRGLLDGVVFSGGEPTLQAGLQGALHDVRALGFEAALHTGGMFPGRLEQVLPRLDWVGLDVKAPWHRLDALTGARGSAARVLASVQALVDSGVPYECRTTWSPALFPLEELHALGQELLRLGVTDWVIQGCRSAAGASTPLPCDALAPLGAGFRRFALREA
jgi:pyruvate formate lyase activating enzyme